MRSGCNRRGRAGVCGVVGVLTTGGGTAEVTTPSFTDLYVSSFARLVGQVAVVTADAGAAEEAVQEAFGRLWARWDTVATYDRPEAWVRRVAINLAISRWRRLRRLRPLADAAHRAHEPDAVSAPDVQRALRTLPVRQRHALLLHHVLGLPVRDVASELGVPEGTVKSWLARGRGALQQLLDPQEASDG